jgi:hypothetical protein
MAAFLVGLLSSDTETIEAESPYASELPHTSKSDNPERYSSFVNRLTSLLLFQFMFGFGTINAIHSHNQPLYYAGIFLSIVCFVMYIVLFDQPQNKISFLP